MAGNFKLAIKIYVTILGIETYEQQVLFIEKEYEILY